MFKYLFFSFLAGLTTSVVAAEQRVLDDYHLTVYYGQQELVSDIELFTKQPDKEVFFGVTCSSMSPFPLIQVLLFNDEVLSDSTRFLRVSYQVDQQKANNEQALQGILKAVDNFEERSNKVRLELDPDQLRSVGDMDRGYQALLSDLKSGKTLQITLHSGAIGKHNYQFSLQGLKALLEPHEAVCR